MRFWRLALLLLPDGLAAVTYLELRDWRRRRWARREVQKFLDGLPSAIDGVLHAEKRPEKWGRA